MKKELLSGNEAVALAALHSGCALGVGYPGTPSSEILERFSEIGGKAEWAPNEKVAAEVALGVAFAENKVLCTMKHVGFNVAQDLFFTAAYSGIQGSYVLIVADDPGMASSQNEQDTRSLALVGGLPIFEPSDSQEAYDFVRLAFEMSHKWNSLVIVRMTTRISHSNTIVSYDEASAQAITSAKYERNVPQRVMVPGHAKPAHRRLRAKLAEIEKWSATEGPNKIIEGKTNELGIISSGVAFQHAYEAAPDAGFFKLGLDYPLPSEKLLEFSKKYKRCVVIEEGDPFLTTQLRAMGANVEQRAETFRFGEFNVDRAAAQIKGETSETPPVVKNKPPQLCNACPHLFSFKTMKDLNLIVAGDIGCYTLSALKPLEAMDIQICMGASIGIGLGMRHVLPETEARKVVSVIGDSTFMHSGLTGLVEMVYNTPATGHVVIVVDNSITAMTGQQENPATGRKLDHSPAAKVSIEAVAKGIGVQNVASFNPIKQTKEYGDFLKESLAKNETTLIVLKQPCVLAAPMIAKLERLNSEK